MCTKMYNKKQQKHLQPHKTNKIQKNIGQTLKIPYTTKDGKLYSNSYNKKEPIYALCESSAVALNPINLGSIKVVIFN